MIEKLKRSVERFRLLHENLRDAMVQVSMNGKIIEFNSQYSVMLGYSHQELRNLTYKDLTPEKWHSFEERIVNEQILTRGYSDVYQKEYRRKDNSVFPVELRTILLTDKEGSPEGMWAIVRDITERKRKEKIIDDLAKLSGENPFPVLRISTEGLVIYANEASSVLKGKLFTGSGSYLSEPWLFNILEIVKEGTPRFEISFNGRFFSFNIVPVLNEGYINMYGVDITELKQAEKDLYLTMKDLSRAQEVGRIGSWRLDIINNVLTWSDENYNIFGVEKGTPQTYESFLSVIHPEDRNFVDKKWKAALAGEPYDIEHRILVNGNVKWVREKAFLEFEGKNNLKGGFGITQDITHMKLNEEDLRRSKDRFELMAYTAGELLHCKEPQKMIESLCIKVLKQLDCHVFFNYLLNESSGRLHLNAFHGIPLQESEKIECLSPGGNTVCNRVAETGLRIVAEHINSTSDKITDLVRSFGIQAYACHPLLSENNRVIGTLSFGTKNRETFSPDDLSLMKAVADQVAIAMNRVNIMNDLSGKNLQLTRLNRLHEDLLYMTAHDLRNPIANMYMTMDLINHVQDVNKKLQMALNLNPLVKQLEALVKSLSEIIQVQSFEDIQYSEVFFEEAFGSIITENRSIIKETGAKISCDFANAPKISYVPTFLDSILKNLFTNSIKYRKKEIPPDISLMSEKQDGYTVLRYTDNGIGIDLEKHGKYVFKPFRRFTRNNEGTGIGLYLIKNLIEKNGGFIEIDSKPGEGTSFFLHFKEY